MKIFVSLILPMLKPALATIGLFLALGYWNEWYQSSLFLSSKVDVKPLQYTLYEVVNKMDQLKNSVARTVCIVSRYPDRGNQDGKCDPCNRTDHFPVSIRSEIFHQRYYRWSRKRLIDTIITLHGAES